AASNASAATSRAKALHQPCFLEITSCLLLRHLWTKPGEVLRATAQPFSDEWRSIPANRAGFQLCAVGLHWLNRLGRAEVAELADAPHSKSGSLRGGGVRFLPSVLTA